MPTPRLLFILLLIPVIALRSQEPIRDPDFLEGNRLCIEGHYDSAYSYFRKAETSARTDNNGEYIAYALGAQGRYLSRMGEAQAAAPLLDTALSLVDSLHPVAFLARRDKAHMLMLSGDFWAGQQAHQHNADLADGLPMRLDSIKAICYHVMGNTLLMLDDYEQAKAYCRKAMEIRERILPPNHVYLAFGENTLGSILMWEEQYKEAYKHLKRSADILEYNFGPSHPQVLKIKTNIAILHTDLGERMKARTLYKQCIPYLDNMQPDGAIITLLNMGSNYMAMGDYHEALNTFDLAEQYNRRFPQSVPIADAYMGSERAHIFSQLYQEEKALQCITQAITEKRALFGENAEELVLDYIKKGQILSDMERFQQAGEAFEYAALLGEKYLGPHAIYRAQAYEYYGVSLLKQGKRQAARSMFKQAERAYAGSELRWNLADVYSHMASSWSDEKNWDSAFFYHERAWNIVEKSKAWHPDSNQLLLAHWSLPPVKDMLLSIAETCLAQYRDQGEVILLKQALHALETSIQVTDSMRHFYETAASRELTMRYLVPEYEKAIGLCMKLSLLDDERFYTERAFLLAEKSKAANLRDHIRSVTALNFAGVPTALVEQERDFRQQLSELANPEADEDFLEKKYLINIAYRSFLDRLEATYPAYYNLKYGQQSPQPTVILKLLDNESALYSYFWGEKQLFIFRLFNEETRLHAVDLEKTDLPSSLSRWLETLTAAVAKGPVLDPGLAVALADILLPDFEPAIKRLTLIPDGKLSYLPFETLITQEASSQALRSQHWLGGQAITSYAYAAELWLEQGQQPATTQASYLGFAPDFGSGNFSTARRVFGPLEFNQYEVTEAAKALHGKALTGQAASEAAVKQLGVKNAILHFATHVIADDSSEMHSRLFLSPSPDSSEDGLLYAWEIYGLALKSPLTVLSACQTGRGPLHRGEGVMSLARAFQYAGSQRVLTTLWHIDDRASSTISSHFFEALSAGEAVDEALQTARKAYLT